MPSRGPDEFAPVETTTDRDLDAYPYAYDVSGRRPAPDLLRGPAVRRVLLGSGETPVLVCSHASALSVLRDRRFSSDPEIHPMPALSPGHTVPFRAFLQRLDGAEHARLRRIVAPPFASDRVQTLVPVIDEIIGRTLDRIADSVDQTDRLGPVDLMHALAVPIPVELLATVVGLPLDRRPEVARHGRAILRRGDGTVAPGQAFGSLRSCIASVLDDRMENGSSSSRDAEPSGPRHPDVLELLVGALGKGELERIDAVHLGLMQFVGGLETLCHSIGMALFSALVDPTFRRVLSKGSDVGLLSPIIDDHIRHASVLHRGVTRVALEDVDIDGNFVPKGTGIVVSLAAANWDESVFPSPEKVVARRTPAHLAFGAGAHRCLGASLVRATLGQTLVSTFQRFPGMTLAIRPDVIEFDTSTGVLGPLSLPVNP